MSGFIRFLGSAFLLLWIAALFFGSDFRGFFPDEYKTYSDDIVNNKWWVFALGAFPFGCGFCH